MHLVLSTLAAKRYKRIGAKDRPKVDRKFEELLQNPLVGKALQGEYQGKFSLKAWPLRIIYRFDSEKQIISIITIDYRGSVYKN